MTNEGREQLLHLLRTRSLQIGRFTLASGMKSHYYFDSKLTTLDPEGAYRTAVLILQELKRRQIDADAIGGLTLGADPIVSAVAAVSFAEPDLYRPLPAFIVRKEPKKHGTQRYIEGPALPPEARVVIVDDVCTTGDSAKKAILEAQAAAARIVAVVGLVDREQGAAANLSDYNFFSLFTASELLDDPQIQQELARLQQQL